MGCALPKVGPFRNGSSPWMRGANSSNTTLHLRRTSTPPTKSSASTQKKMKTTVPRALNSLSLMISGSIKWDTGGSLNDGLKACCRLNYWIYDHHVHQIMNIAQNKK